MDLKHYIETNALDERSFGRIIRERRESLGKTVRGLAAELEITPSYLSDIEKGNRPAPTRFLDKFRTLLNIPEDQAPYLEYLASATRGKEYEDINPYLGQKPLARIALRKARDLNISDEQWASFIQQIDASSQPDR